MSQAGRGVGNSVGFGPQEHWGRIVDTITDPDRLVVRSWTGGSEGEYSLQKMERQFQGIYETDWDAERQIVIAEPFMSYVVHDAVAMAGKADLLPDLYRRWTEFLEGGYDTIGECWGWGTHVHGWSCTPTRDMIFYTAGGNPCRARLRKSPNCPPPRRLDLGQGYRAHTARPDLGACRGRLGYRGLPGAGCSGSRRRSAS